MQKEIETAVKWWSQFLETTAKFDNGDNSHTGFITSVMASMLSENVKTTTQDKEKFEKAFTQILEEKYKTNWDENNPIFGAMYNSISVDYHPCKYLCDAVSLAGLDYDINNKFPYKTNMRVRPGFVSVSYGYGAKQEVLYTDNRITTFNIQPTENQINKYKEELKDENVFSIKINDFEKYKYSNSNYLSYSFNDWDDTKNYVYVSCLSKDAEIILKLINENIEYIELTETKE